MNQTYRFPLNLVLADLLLVFLSAMFSHEWRFGAFEMNFSYLILTLTTAFLFVLSSSFFDRYDRPGEFSFSGVYRNTLIPLVTSFTLVIVSLVVLKESTSYSRLWLLVWFLLSLLFLILLSVMWVFLNKFFSSLGYGVKSVMMVGSAGSSLQAIKIRVNKGNFGYKIDQTVDINNNKEQNLKNISMLYEKVTDHKVDEVWICLPLASGEYIRDITYALRHSTVEMRFLPQMDDINILNHRSSYVAGLYSIDLSCSPLSGFNGYLKRFADILITIILLPLIIPVCIIISLCVKFSSKGPVLFKQHRHGLGGEPIKIYKFRSMFVDPDEVVNVKQAEKGDARVTRLGRFLRRTSLDEIPQFFNVLQGRMSLVGPRPHALQHNEYYKDLVESYMWRHKVKPGITGWAQVNGFRGETDTLKKMKDRVDADLWYIENWSIWLDLKIILYTSIKVIYDKNAY